MRDLHVLQAAKSLIEQCGGLFSTKTGLPSTKWYNGLF